MPDAGKFITFEGPEGSGKTTQIALLKKYLAGRGFSVLTTREPGGEDAAEKIRQVLLSPKYSLEPMAELFLYASSRIQHVEKIIKPALKKGMIVLSDRFYDATMAYQGYGRRISKDLIKKINRLSSPGLKPDLTILMDIEPHLGLKRARHNKKSLKKEVDRIEKESLAFHRRVRGGYLKLSRKEPERIKVVKVKEVKETQEKIREIVANVV